MIVLSDYSNYSDLELFRLASEGQPEAEEFLAKRYLPLIKKCARPFFLVGGDSEDLNQEGTFGLISAIRRFNPELGVSFQSFAEKCITNRIISAIKAASSNKHSPLNSGVSLDDFPGDLFSDAVQCSAEDYVIAAENRSELSSDIYSKLTKFEKSVLTLFLEGLSYREISEKLGKNTKSIDNAVQRIRHKLAEIYH